METAPLMPLKEVRKSEQQQRSQFTALIYFKREFANDPGTNISSERGRKFHSWKQEQRIINGVPITDHKFALTQLYRMINQDFNGKYKTALIYWNKTNEVIAKFSYDILRLVKEPIWMPHGEFGKQIHKFK